ncbi:MAG: hypothetical protein JWQ09_1513 [Segetibacter sp.]|nr:hypothetical protein [Segetibacter sp.]
MQPVKISIQGDYIDCQIYRGRLYLWTFNGSVKVYHWAELIESLIKRETDRIAMTFCFIDGNYLYKSSIIQLFSDDDFRKLLLQKFASVSNKEFTITPKRLVKFLIGEQETPTGIIPTDTEVYSNNLYFITEEGLFVGSTHRDKGEKYPVSSRPKKLWDCNLLSIKANKYPQIALSGGSEGLFELNMTRLRPEKLKAIDNQNPIFQVSSNHSSFSNYAYLSIYNSSVIENSFMALFKWNTEKENYREVYRRDFKETITEDEIFQSKTDEKHLSWGIEDKIYRATKNGFEIVRFNNYADENEGESKFTQVETLDLHSWKGKVINGGTAYFGTLVECENALIVMLSNGENLTIKGPITRWRVYPRSLNYENHLHVILEDRIEIYSFNQDYFLNQQDKELGIEFKPEKLIRGSYSKKKPVSSNMLWTDLPF